MSLSVEDLATFVGGTVTDELADALTVAERLIEHALRPAFAVCPAEVRDRVTLEVAGEISRRKDSSTGVSQFATFEGGTQPVRGPRDPLTQVWPILRLYTAPF